MYALFDGDIIVFRCGFAAERRKHFLKVDGKDYEFEYKREAKAKLDELVPGQYSRKEGEDYEMWSEVVLEPLDHAVQNVKTLVRRCLDAVQCNDFDVRMYLSPAGGNTFRHSIATTKPYKGNRDRSHRPTYESDIREYIQRTWDTTVAENEEADDLLGIEGTKMGDECVIISLDKDLDQIPGNKYNYLHEVAYYVDEATARKNFYLQLLKGDSTDNIPGLPGIGEGKALKALHGLETDEEMLRECITQYQIHSGVEDWEAYLIEQGRLLWIRRYPGQLWGSELETTLKEQEVWDNQELSLL
jgi:hypothetical protein